MTFENSEIEQVPRINYEDKVGMIRTSFGDITIEALPQGLIIKGIPGKPPPPETYSPNEADKIVSMLIDPHLVGDEMAMYVHSYREKRRALKKLILFKTTCTCQGSDVLEQFQSMLTMDVKSLMTNIQKRLYISVLDIDTHESIGAFLMETVRIANELKK
ncbi:MAG: hypothetical protein AAB870_00490 [Patescibacteria group bacterium]